MCFSAPVSFAVAAATGLVGAAAMSKTLERREIPLAAIPLIFAAQQTIEGALWFALGSDQYTNWVPPLANAFTFLALVVWPVFAPLATVLIERSRERRLAMAVLLAFSAALAVRGLGGMWAQPYGACVVQNSIAYENGLPYSPLHFAAYSLCTCGPFLLSSDKGLRVFGTIVIAGLVISVSLYLFAFTSVWCFFAAVGSLTIYLYFARANKERAKTLPR